jgi:hypothetical protein
MKRFVVACPRNSRTGGPEALHQLVDALSGAQVEAVLWDPYPDGGPIEENHYFAQYKVEWTQTAPTAGDVLVVPEVMGELIPRFYRNCQCVFWWLSVDNFFKSDKYPLETLIQLFPQVIHVAQSRYAQDFLQSQGIEEVLMLTDYINQEFIIKYQEHSSLSIKPNRDFDVAVNTAKGFDRASKVMMACRDLTFVLLEHMSREEVISSLSRSRIYLDLGEHPGTDRIPREAALLGCVIVTNRRGSAGNQIDLAIDGDLFKHSDEEFGFEVSVQQALMKILSSLENAKSKQENYVAWITEANYRFEDEIMALVSKIQDSNYLISDFEKNIANAIDLAYRDRDRIFVERNELVVERDQLTADRDRIFVERNELVVERDQLTADRDRIFVERNELVVERDRLTVDRDQLTADRDRLTSELSAIKSSIMWKLAYPLQVIRQFVKKTIGTTR